MTPRAALDLGLAELRLMVPDAARAQLMAYMTLLAKWNRTYNLTAIDDPLRMVSHHLLDSLAVLPHLPMTGGAATLSWVARVCRTSSRARTISSRRTLTRCICVTSPTTGRSRPVDDGSVR